MQVMKAASVLPDPVGAAISVCRPLGYGGPARFLGVRGGLEALVEPALDQGMEPLRHRHSCTGKGVSGRL